MIAMYRK